MLFFSNQEIYATGKMTYEYRPIDSTDNNYRIIVHIKVDGIPALAAVDTGAPYLILSPIIAKRLDFTPSSSLEPIIISIRGYKFSGNLCRVDILLLADEGESGQFQATTFVPDNDQEEQWGNLPSFLGLQNCLDRIRFAFDPSDETIYFGPLP